MRLLWIYTFALTLVFAFVFQTVNANEFNKKGSKHKGMSEDDPHKYHPAVVPDGAASRGRGINNLPASDRSPSYNKNHDRSSSSGSHGSDKATHQGGKGKHKKHRKQKHHRGNKNHAGGKNRQ